MEFTLDLTTCFVKEIKMCCRADLLHIISIISIIIIIITHEYVNCVVKYMI